MSLYGAGAPSEYSLAASLPAAGILTPNSLPAASAGAAPYSFERSWLAHLNVSDAKCGRRGKGTHLSTVARRSALSRSPLTLI